MKTTKSRVPGTNRASFVAKGSRSRRRMWFDFERLEDRTLLTVLYTPQVTPVTIQDFGGPKLGTTSPGVAVNMIFWGSYWQTPDGQTQSSDDMALVNAVLGGSLLSGLHQYGSNYGIDTSATQSVFDGSTDPGTDFTDSQIQGEVDHAISTLGLTDSSNAIYYVVTPPDAQYADHTLGGYHAPETLSDGSYRYYGWLGNFGATSAARNDWFTSILSRETLNAFSDPAANLQNGVTVTSLPGEIADGEATNYTELVNNNLVQSFWSNTDNAYAINDGNTQKVVVNQGSLIVNGDQNGVIDDVVTLGLNIRGGVLVTLNGETFSFAPNAIQHITVNTGAGTNNVVTIQAGTLIPMTIKGGSTGNTLVGPDMDTLWRLTGANSGKVGLVDFQGFATLQGGSGNDTFTFDAGSSLAGRIDGGAGTNTIDESAFTAPISLNLLKSTVSGIQNPFANIQGVIGGTNAANILYGPTTGSTFNITGPNTGSVSGLMFSGFGNITAGPGDDRFVFSDAATLSGTLSGGLGSNAIDESAYTSAVATSYSTKTITGVGTNYAGIQTFIGSAIAGGNLTGPTTPSTYNVTGKNSLNVGGASYNNFSSLNAGAGNDLFLFSPSGSLGGSINGGLGANTIDESSFTTPVALNLAANTVTGVGATYANIQKITPGTGSNTLTGPSTGSTYNITGPNAGDVAGFNFNRFGRLIGGQGNDVFKFTNAGILTGGIDGGSGSNTIDDSAVTTLVTLNLAASTVSQVAGTFSNIQGVVAGNNASNQIVGPATSSIFNITGTNSGNIAGLSFSGFSNLFGGGGDDTFAFGPSASLLGQLDGGPGANTLDYSILATTVAVNLALATATDLGKPFANIQKAVGGSSATNVFTGPSLGSTYRITSRNSGTVNGFSFSAFGNIMAGAGDDTIVFSDGASLSGTLNVGSGANSIDETAYTTAVNVNLASKTITGVGVNYAGVIGSLKASNTAAGTLTGLSTSSIFNITGTNSGNVGGMSFLNFSSIIGGAGNDAFVFSDAASLTGSIDGGPGSNTLDQSASTAAVIANLSAMTVNGVGGTFANIQTLKASTTSGGTLTGPSAGSTFTILGLNTGTVGATNFLNFNNLVGGPGSDTFYFRNQTAVTGTIDGGLGNNTIDQSSYTTSVVLNIQSSTLTGVASFTRIQSLIGSSNAYGTLTGPATATSYNFTGRDIGSLAGIAFRNYSNFNGGASNDTFIFNASTYLDGRIDGGAGSNTLDYSAVPAALRLTFLSQTQLSTTLIAQPCLNIQREIGGNSSQNTIYGPSVGTNYSLTAINAGNFNGFSFKNFSRLYGGVGNDIFAFNDGASLSFIQGGGGLDAIDASSYTTPVSAIIDASPRLILSGSTAFFNAIGSITAGSAVSLNTMTSAAATTFNITGLNSGNLSTPSLRLAFSGFGNLAGGTGNDLFKLGNLGSIVGTIDGGGGANTIDESAYTTPVLVDVDGQSMSGLSTYSRVQTIIGPAIGSTLFGPLAGTSYLITGRNSGNIPSAGLTFVGFSSIIGGPNTDSYTFSNGASIDGQILNDGGADRIDQSSYSTTVEVNLAAGTLTGTAGISGIQTVIGSATAGGRLIGPSTNSTFNISSNNAGNVAGVNFTNYSSLVGGPGDDNFVFARNGSLTGSINGGAGTNIIDQSSYTAATALNLANNTITGVGSTFANIQNITGGISTANSLTGPAANSIFAINGSNAGSVGGLNFSNFGNLVGGTGNDRFVFSTGAKLSGRIDGGSGVNTIDESGISDQVSLNLLSNSITGLGSTFVNIQNVVGGSNPGNILYGPTRSATYSLTGLNSGNVAGINYSAFSGIVGGPGNDVFMFSDGARITRGIDGGAGTNTIDQSAYTTGVVTNLSAMTITGVGSTVTNVQVLKGSSIAGGTLTGPMAGSLYTILGLNTGIVGTTSFQNYSSLIGGAGDDQFYFRNQASLTGGIDGGSGYNTIDQSSYITPVLLNIQTNTLTGVPSFTRIQSLIGSSSALGSLTGPTTDTTYNFTGRDIGTVAGFSFRNFGTFIGGAGNDAFLMNASTYIDGFINGGAGSNTLDYSSLSTSVTVNLSVSTAMGLRNPFTNIQNAIGGSSATNVLIGPSSNSIYRITGQNAGTVNGFGFLKFGNILAGAGDDAFVFSDGATLSGTLNVGLGSNSIDESAYMSTVNTNLATKTITGVGTNFTGVIASLKGSNTAGGTLTGLSTSSIFNITGTNAGNVGGISFLNFSSIIAGAGNDAFVFSDRASLTGSIDGGAGTNTVDQTASTNPVMVNLAASTISGVGAMFTNIQTWKGSTNAGGTLTGPSAGSTVTILGLNSETIGGASFVNFNNLVGGSGNDTFYFRDQASVTGVVDGGAGINTVDESSYTTAVLANLQMNTLTGMANFTRIQSLIASTTAYGNLTGPSSSSTFNITAKNVGSVGGIGFTNYANLSGGSDDDLFLFGRTGTLTGIVDGGSGNNTIDESSSTSIISLNLANKTLTGIGATFANIQKVMAGLNTANQVVAPNFSGSIYITGINAGAASNVNFSGFGNLVGGTGNDLFVFSDGASVSGSVDGGTGSNGLDYRAYTTNISVNQTTGKATGVGTTISHIEYVNGRAAADTLNVSVSPNTPIFGQMVTFTASLSPASATGTVVFLDGSIPLNPGGTTLDASGRASFSTSNLSVGSHQITATYGGDLNYATATSTGTSLPVFQDPTTTTILLSPSSSVFGQSVSATATLSPASATGTVIFYDGSTPLNPSGTALNGLGQASFAINGLTVGSHQIRAVYSGDTNDTPSSSIALSEKVGAVSLFQDPSVQFAVLQALGLPSNHLLTAQDLVPLTTLSLDSSQVRNLSGLESATNLVSLTLVPSDFSHAAGLTSLIPLEHLPNLTSLTLQGSGLTDSILNAVPSSAFPVLRSLDLRYNRINVVPTSIASLPNLSNLSLYGNPLTVSPRAGLVNLAGKLVNIDLPPDHPEMAQTISGLAAALYNLPIEIYQYVTNTITYQPYAGAMKGPLAVLQTGAGNDWDTDSLLAALLAQPSGTPITQYVSGAIGENVPTIMKWLGVKTPASAYEVLYYAGLRPTFGILTTNSQNQQVFTPVDVSQANTAPYIAFDHSWLQANFNVPGAGIQTATLDPSWNFRDFQPGLPGLLGKVAFDSTGYLSTVSSQLAYEYYQNQVRNYLAANQPNITIADIAYDGPIHPISITSLPTAVPYDLDAIQSVTTTIPMQSQNRLQISVDIQSAGTITGGIFNSLTNQTVVTVSGGAPFTAGMLNEPLIDLSDGNQVFTIVAITSSSKVVVQGDASRVKGAGFATPGISTLQNVADISLDRITIVAPGTGSVRPQLTFTGPILFLYRAHLLS